MLISASSSETIYKQVIENETFQAQMKETKQPTGNFANITNLAISNVYKPEPIIFNYDLLSWGGKGVIIKVL